jgi:hypothetical protein
MKFLHEMAMTKVPGLLKAAISLTKDENEIRPQSRRWDTENLLKSQPGEVDRNYNHGGWGTKVHDLKGLIFINIFIVLYVLIAGC